MESLLIFVKVVEEERLMMTRHLLTLTPVNLKFLYHYNRCTSISSVIFIIGESYGDNPSDYIKNLP